jgi:hypothetical protein
MANRIEQRGEWTKDQSKFVYVEIPARDMYDYEYPTIRINTVSYEAGKKHFVPPEIADELKRIMARFDLDNRRLLLPTPNKDVRKFADQNG